MEAGSILDYKKELAKKTEFMPDDDTKAYIEAQMREYQWDVFQFQKKYRVFNDRSFLDYMTLAEDDFFKYVPKPKDPFDWRNFIRSGDERNRLDSLYSFLTDLNFKVEPAARDWMGNVIDEMGEFAESFLQYLNILDESDVKDGWSDLAMHTHGTLFKQVKFVTRKGIDKIAENWNPAQVDGYSYKTREIDEFEGVESTVWKPNRVFLSDVSQPLVSKQDHIWYESIIPYANAHKLFNNYERWKYVQPYNPQYDQWTDTETDVEAEDKEINDKVRVRVRESTATKELSIYCNRILMTPIGLKLPDDDYSMFYQQASLLQPTGAFAYGRSYMDNLRSIVGVKDVLTSIFVDTSRQDLEMPMKSRFRTMVNRYMFKPGSVTPMQGEGDLTPLIPQGANRSFALEALKIYEDMQDKASPSPLLKRPEGGPEKTRRQIELEMQQAISMVAGMVGASVNWRKQEARLKLKFGLKNFSKITGFKFEVPGDNGISSRNVEFKSFPTGDTKAEKKMRYDMIKKMSEAQNLSKRKGKRTKNYIIDTGTVNDYSFVIDFRVNPKMRDSKSGDISDLKEKIADYRQAPTLDQSAVDKILVRAHNDDEEELIKKPQAQAPQAPGQTGMPGQPSGQPGQPQMGQPPQMSQGQPMPPQPNPMMQPQI